MIYYLLTFLYEIVPVILDECPHCRATHVQLSMLFVTEWGESGGRTWAVLAQCQNTLCQRRMFFLCDSHPQRTQPKRIDFLYPLCSGTLPKELDLPGRIREEFMEAAESLQIGAILASMTMSRRVLQRCLKAQGFEERNLYDQIEAAKKDGTMPKRYHELADEIRKYGNIGAHPDDDKIELVTTENANQLLEFIRILIEEFYVLPARAKELQSKRQAN